MSTLGAAQPWRIIVPPPANEAAMLQLLNELRGECAVLPVGSQVEHVLSHDFDMLVEPEECVDCGVQLLRGELVYQRPLEGWIPIRVGRGVALRRPRAWLGGMAFPGPAETVCGSCAAAELLPRYDEQERQRIVASARAALYGACCNARVVVDGITWKATVQLDQAEWLIAAVSQTEVLPGCHLFGFARWTPDGVELDVEGLSQPVRLALERELWLELEVRGDQRLTSLV